MYAWRGETILDFSWNLVLCLTSHSVREPKTFPTRNLFQHMAPCQGRAIPVPDQVLPPNSFLRWKNRQCEQFCLVFQESHTDKGGRKILRNCPPAGTVTKISFPSLSEPNTPILTQKTHTHRAPLRLHATPLSKATSPKSREHTNGQ